MWWRGTGGGSQGEYGARGGMRDGRGKGGKREF